MTIVYVNLDKKNKTLWYCLENDFKNLDGDEFETLIGILYQRRGFHVIKTPKGSDNGVDLLARKGKISIIIQTKNWSGKVTNSDILKTAGARTMFGTSYALVITSSHFTKSAKEVIKNTPRIRGMDVDGLKRQFQVHFKKEIKKPKPGTIGTTIREIFFKKPKIPEVSILDLGKVPEKRVNPPNRAKRHNNKRNFGKRRPKTRYVRTRRIRR